MGSYYLAKQAASEYDNIPKHLKTDNVIPSASEIPILFSSIRHPQRRASISIGPQSEADAHEALAFRRRKRGESLSSVTEKREMKSLPVATDNKFGEHVNDANVAAYGNGVPPPSPRPSIFPSNTDQVSVDRDLKTESALSVNDAAWNPAGILRSLSQDRRQDERDKREIFSNLEKPRVRYDVEVITKLIVYTGTCAGQFVTASPDELAGIAWLAVEGNPIIFHYIGLGMDSCEA